MEESNVQDRVSPELYFLITKFLLGGPLKETAKTLLEELQTVELLPRRLDWEGSEHPQSYSELASQYTDIPWNRLVAVCERAVSLAQITPLLSLKAIEAGSSEKINPRLSLLGYSLAHQKPKYCPFKQDNTIVRRLASRELGGVTTENKGQTVEGLLPARLLTSLQLQRRTLGHLSAVYCLVFDCTGRYVITGADDLLIKVWNAMDGRLIATLRGAGAEITDVCVSYDNALLACGSMEKLVRVWCLATGAPKAVLHAHAGTITSVRWAPPSCTDVRWLASTSTDGSVAFWTCSKDGHFLSQPVQYVERMRPGACHMICAAWSAGGAFLAAGSADHHVRVYTVEPNKPQRVLEVAVHSEAVDSIAWAHRGLRFVSGSKDGSAAIWTLHATQWRHSLLICEPTQDYSSSNKRLKVTMVCWDSSDAYVLTAVSDNTIRVWCSRTSKQLRSLCGHRDEAYVLEPHPFLPGVVLSAGHDGQMFVWDANNGEILAQFHNQIEGQGDGAIFDAKWGGGAHIAASDSHGHLLLLGLGQGHKLLKELPTELFFHTDYRPLTRDALGGALDEQTDTPPHLMPPPFLVDVEGAPHPPLVQRLVPGRENLTFSQQIPAAEVRNRIDVMIEALAAERIVGLNNQDDDILGRGVWRGEGVRHTAGAWQTGDPMDLPYTTRVIVAPLSNAARRAVEQTSSELNSLEVAWYRREMRRRPLMITTSGDGASGPRRKPGRRPAGVAGVRNAPTSRTRPPPRPAREEEPPDDSSGSDSSDESVRLSDHRTPSNSSQLDSDMELNSSSSSSQYSDWEAGTALAPPARARRRPLPAKRYSPSVATPTKRAERASAPKADSAYKAESTVSPKAPTPVELPEAYRPGEWLCAVSPRKAPYHPQMGDHCMYFRLGHQRYFEAVSEKDIYKVNPRDKPWERTNVYDCELVKVVGIKYVIKPPRVACLKLACHMEPPRCLSVRYHDMPDVIDFLVLKQQFFNAVSRGWKQGDRFRCMIDDSWWTGVVLENSAPAAPGECPAAGKEPCLQWATAAAAHFLALRVRWDNGEVERLSPWDLEPLDPDRLPSEPGGSVPVLPHELEAVLYKAEAEEWPPRGDRAAACRAIAHHVNQVMSLSVAEPFVVPVDLQAYPSYAMVVCYPIDLSTIRSRFDNLFYRRTAAAQFDVRYLASNAEQFNESHSPIVRQARLVTDLLLHIISNWSQVDVLAKYHELAASYHSSEDEPLSKSASGMSRINSASPTSGKRWRKACSELVRKLIASSDAAPFREPVSIEQAPDYYTVITTPIDLGTISQRLSNGYYSTPEQFAEDVRLVFKNSRHYNTNKRSRIFSMTVRLSSLFEELWSRVPSHATRRPRRCTRKPKRLAHYVDDVKEEKELPSWSNGTSSRVPPPHSSSSDSETLAMTSRRVHQTGPRGREDSLDSDVPLYNHRKKGKGVGKKSKSGSNSAEPVPSTSTANTDTIPHSNGLASVSRSQSNPVSDEELNNIQVLEEELVEDDIELTYTESREHSPSRHRRKRRKLSSGSSAVSSPIRRRRRKKKKHKHRHKPKRIRERFTDGSPSSSSASSGEDFANPTEAKRYESDHSYKPRYSTDDDAPLNVIRQRQEESTAEPRPSTSRIMQNGKKKRSGVKLRARRSPRKYNEDSEDESVAAISKRIRPVNNTRTYSRHNHASRGGSLSATRGHTNDHNYSGSGLQAATDREPSSAEQTPLSISSRGRVRKLTAKARGLLHS